jgi:transposase
MAELELRATIKVCVGLGKTPKQTIEMIKESTTSSSCSLSFVYKWHERFRNGRTSLEDDPREGRPASETSSILDLVRD